MSRIVDGIRIYINEPDQPYEVVGRIVVPDMNEYDFVRCIRYHHGNAGVIVHQASVDKGTKLAGGVTLFGKGVAWTTPSTMTHDTILVSTCYIITLKHTTNEHTNTSPDI